jgi:N-acetyl-anhydromuramyl-L-alanine amidase AmpD
MPSAPPDPASHAAHRVAVAAFSRTGAAAVLLLLCGACSRQTVPAMRSTPQLRIPAAPAASLAVPAELQVKPVQWTSEWSPEGPERDWKFIVLHHTATDSGSVESIHRTHLARKDADGNPWRGIGYHFVIGNGNGMPDGSIEPTFRWNEQIGGAHAGDSTYNEQGIGVCLIGNFETDSPSAAQMESLTRLLQTLSGRYRIPPHNIKGHGEVKSTACPGRLFPLEQLTQAIVPTDTSALESASRPFGDR